MTDTGTERDVERVVLRICQDVCELPDRSSPDDEPDQVLVTLGELSEICRRVLTDELAALRPATDEAKPSEAERESVVQALIAEIQRQTEGDWPIDADHGKYIIDAAIDFDALAIAAMRSSDGAKGEKS